MKRCIPILMFCALLTGCASTLTTDGVEGVIFPANKAEFAIEMTGRKNATTWTPLEKDIAKAMPAIKAFLVKQAPAIATKLTQYQCQYFGVIVDGKRLIYCNFFHRGKLDRNWKSEPVLVCDGGDYFFQLEYDTESGQCLKFSVNGEA